MQFLRLMPGKGEVILAEGDPELTEDEQRLIDEFRRQLDSGMWAAVPVTEGDTGRREAIMVQRYSDIPEGAERVVFFPRPPAAETGAPPSGSRVSTVLFLTMALVAFALGAYLAAESIRERWRRRPRRGGVRPQRFDPGTERRAERRARTLLRSIVNEEEWEMYRDLGFIRVHGSQNRPRGVGESYGYLIYPHKPIVAYLQGSNSLLSEYCVEFPDHDENVYGPKLPDSDDVLAKWMMIRADEERLIRGANMHLPGRQVDPQQVRRDLWRLAEWERARGHYGHVRVVRRPGGEPAASAS